MIRISLVELRDESVIYRVTIRVEPRDPVIVGLSGRAFDPAAEPRARWSSGWDSEGSRGRSGSPQYRIQLLRPHHVYPSEPGLSRELGYCRKVSGNSCR